MEKHSDPRATAWPDAMPRIAERRLIRFCRFCPALIKRRIPISAQHALLALVLALVVCVGAAQAVDLDPKAITIQLPNQIKWVESPDGSATAVVRGDPTQPGQYILLVKWHAHHMSQPHFHPNDRFVTVISGTWWVGTGTKFDPNSTVPLPPGSFVRHTAKQIHYDGAKDQEVMLQIVGEGPATMIMADKK